MNITVLRKKKQNKIRRRYKIRKSIFGVKDYPRLSLYVSLTRLSVQVIDDSSSNTICSANQLGKNIANSKLIGKALAKKLKEKNISRVVFDRNGKKYWGVVKQFCESLRENGIEI